MSRAAAVALSVLTGLAGSLQAAVNGRLGTRGGTLETFAFSVTVTVTIAIGLLLVGRRSLAGYAEIARQPWWLWIGGVMGAIAVLGITFAAPRIGTFATIALIIAGQLGMAAVIDRFGLFGLERIPLHAPRVLGLVLLAAGAALALKK